MASMAEKSVDLSPARKSAVKEALLNVRRRRTYLINPDIQFSITRQFMLVVAAAGGLGIGNYHVATTLFEAGQMDEVGIMLSLGYSVVMFVVSAALLFLLCVFFSHRIAGPVGKIAEALDGMAHGDFSVKVRLRDGDFLKELAGGLNTTNRALRSALAEVDRDVRRARGLAAGNSELEGCLARVEAKLESFRLTTGVELDPRSSIVERRKG